jgi:hypothetical protein
VDEPVSHVRHAARNTLLAGCGERISLLERYQRSRHITQTPCGVLEKMTLSQICLQIVSIQSMARTGVKLPVGAVRFLAEKMGFADLGDVLQLQPQNNSSSSPRYKSKSNLNSDARINNSASINAVIHSANMSNSSTSQSCKSSC